MDVIVYTAVVAPLMADPFRNHWYDVTLPGISASTLKCKVLPIQEPDGATGCILITGGAITVTAAALLRAVPQVPVTTT
jgi:hypothetical protein